jgi:hypothetical protein
MKEQGFLTNVMPAVCIGAFRDNENGIEGTPGPMYIHTNKSKTKVKEAKERQRQCSGGTPEPNRVLTHGFPMGWKTQKK